MQLIPSLDLLNGRVVRLTHGDFATARDYGEPEAILDHPLAQGLAGHPAPMNLSKLLSR